MRCHGVSTGKHLLTFRKIVLLSSSGSRIPGPAWPEVEGSTILGSACNCVKYEIIHISWCLVTSQKTCILRIYFLIWFPRLLQAWCCLHLLLLILRRKVTPKLRYVCTKLRCAKSQKANIFISAALKTFYLAVVKEIVSFTLIEVCENVLVTAGNIYIYIYIYIHTHTHTHTHRAFHNVLRDCKHL
jgi:hypothetical protein